MNRYLLLHQFDTCCENVEEIRQEILKKKLQFYNVPTLNLWTKIRPAFIRPLLLKQFQIVKHYKTKNV